MRTERPLARRILIVGELVRVFDTTLRDGDQMPGVELSLEDKIDIVKLLDEVGVDVIEAGFPASSRIDFETIKLAVREVGSARVAALARCSKRDIEEAAASEAQIIHVFIATSDIHLRYKLNISREQVIESVISSIDLVRELGAEALFSAEDATRSDKDFLVKVYRAAVSAGARYINIPDTVGVATPWTFMKLVRRIASALPPGVKIDVHCHNDFGMATANSLAAIEEGADGVQVTVNGFGERSGNAPLEEVVAALHFLMGRKTRVKLERLTEVSRFVAEKFGVSLQPHKPIVGINAFAHESGIHVHGVLSNPLTYEPIRPEDVGNKRRIVLGRHSGRHSVSWALEQMGIKPEPSLVAFVLERIKEVAPRMKKVPEEQISRWVEEYFARGVTLNASGRSNTG
ncbi:MAG: 2-isopropylmalate synthase [Fervidicoccaceae archaeon]